MIDDRKRAETVASTQKENGEREAKRSEGEEGKGEEEHMTTTKAGKSVGIHARQADIRNPTVGSSSLDAECRILSLFL